MKDRKKRAEEVRSRENSFRENSSSYINIPNHDMPSARHEPDEPMIVIPEVNEASESRA